jgi:hypothetical protein
MTAALDRLDIDFLAGEVAEFEQLNGDLLSDAEVPDAYDCGGNCFGCCTAKVRASGVTTTAKTFVMAITR